MGQIAAGVPGGDILHPQQQNAGGGKVDAVAPARVQEVLHKVLPRRHGRGVQVILRQTGQIVGCGEGGGHRLPVILRQARVRLHRHPLHGPQHGPEEGLDPGGHGQVVCVHIGPVVRRQLRERALQGRKAVLRPAGAVGERILLAHGGGGLLVQAVGGEEGPAAGAEGDGHGGGGCARGGAGRQQVRGGPGVGLRVLPALPGVERRGAAEEEGGPRRVRLVRFHGHDLALRVGPRTGGEQVHPAPLHGGAGPASEADHRPEGGALRLADIQDQVPGLEVPVQHAAEPAGGGAYQLVPGVGGPVGAQIPLPGQGGGEEGQEDPHAGQTEQLGPPEAAVPWKEGGEQQGPPPGGAEEQGRPLRQNALHNGGQHRQGHHQGAQIPAPGPDHQPPQQQGQHPGGQNQKGQPGAPRPGGAEHVRRRLQQLLPQGIPGQGQYGQEPQDGPAPVPPGVEPHGQDGGQGAHRQQLPPAVPIGVGGQEGLQAPEQQGQRHQGVPQVQQQPVQTLTSHGPPPPR